MERLSDGVLICCRSQWSSLVSKYQKAHPHVKQRIVVIFLYFFQLLLTSYGWQKREKNNKMDIFVAEFFDIMKG